jgi:Ca2+-binding EF-hand superfamily protein
MNKKAIASIFIVSAAIGAGSVQAFPKQNNKGAHFSRFINKFDTDKNGEVSREEFDAAMEQRFATMDSNKDGVVSQEEFKQQAKAKRQAHKKKYQSKMKTDSEGRISKQAYLDAKMKWAEQKFARLDKDGDGFLSQEERMAAKMTKRSKRAHHYFSKIDANSDGMISADENRASADRMFTKMDKNGDQVITQDEIQAMMSQHKKR